MRKKLLLFLFFAWSILFVIFYFKNISDLIDDLNKTSRERRIEWDTKVIDDKVYGEDFYDFMIFCETYIPSDATVRLIVSKVDDLNTYPIDSNQWYYWFRAFSDLFPREVYFTDDKEADYYVIYRTRDFSWGGKELVKHFKENEFILRKKQ